VRYDKINAVRYGKQIFKIKYADIDDLIDKDGEMYKALTATKQSSDTNSTESKKAESDNEKFECLPSDSWGLPQDLIFDGKPLDPGVIETMASGDSSRLEPKRIQDCINKDVKRPGGRYFGYEYIPECYLNSGSGLFCYCSWNYLGTLENGKTHVISTDYGDYGGTGCFSCVFLMQRNGDFVQNIKHLAAGDRGSGGIFKSVFKDNMVFIKQHITHYDFFKTCVQMLAAEDSTVIFDSDYTNGYLKYKEITIPRQIYAKLPDCYINWVGIITSSWQNDALKIVECKLTIDEASCYDDDDEVDEDLYFDCKLPLFNKCFEAVVSRYSRPSKKKLDRNGMKNFAREVLDLYLQKRES
jgi:hypothetical protein